MPSPTGGETINERLTRLRAELARVRVTISRHETNGSSFNIGGTQVTEIAYERALKRESDLEGQIKGLECRLTGSRSASPFVQTQTRMP